MSAYIASSGYTTILGPGVTFISGTGAAIEVSVGTPEQEVPLRYTRLKLLGTELLNSLAHPTHVGYLEWVARQLEEHPDVTVDLWLTEDDREASILSQWAADGSAVDAARLDRTTITPLSDEE